MRWAPASRQAWGLATIFLFALLSGCIDGGPPDPASADDGPRHAILPPLPFDPFWDNPIEDGPDHDHRDAAQHADHRNVDLLGGLGRGEADKGEFGEIDIVGDLLLQCLYLDGFRLLDITDRLAPVEVGRYSGPRCFDIKATSDGALAIVSGTHLVDITDRSGPELAHRYKSGGCHMCTIHTIDGVEYVFLAQSLAMDRALIPVQGVVEVTRIERGEPLNESRLVHVSDWSAPITSWPNTHVPDANGYEMSIHDMYVYDDPDLGIPIMVVAHWDMGVFFVDVSDPANPQTLGHWDDFRGDCGDIHTVEVDWIDGRRIVAAATENGLIIDPACSAARWSVGFVYLIDATDFAAPVTLGKWHVPDGGPLGLPSEPWPKASNVGDNVGAYSAHNLQFLNGRVYEAMYHGGVFVLDAATLVREGGADPLDTFLRKDTVPTIGAYFPTCEDGGPLVWDLFPKDGYLYVSDMTCGLFVLRFIGDPLGDPAWTGDA